MLLDTLGASLLDKFIIRKRNCKSWLWWSLTKQNEYLIPPHPLRNFEIQKYLKYRNTEILKYRNIMRMNQDLMVFIHEIIYLKK